MNDGVRGGGGDTLGSRTLKHGDIAGGMWFRDCYERHCLVSDGVWAAEGVVGIGCWGGGGLWKGGGGC